MKIDGRTIGPDQPPYVIAEISCNHGGSLKRALELIDAAKACGADAVKFQAYTADTITIDSRGHEFVIQDGPWKGRRLHDLYKESETPFEWFPVIKARAARAGITWLASVFDKTAVDLMVKLDAPAIKIASFEINDLPLIRYAAATGKPLIISTGMASLAEIKVALIAAMTVPDPAPWTEWEQTGSILKPAVLHCVSGYPSEPGEANLRRIGYLADELGALAGISDHSLGVEIPIAATALGTCIIEKHFRLSWHPDTEDSPFSLDEVDFAKMGHRVRNTWLAMQLSSSGSEAPQRPLRRSLFVVADVKTGEPFTEANVRSIRPGHGLHPDLIGTVLGCHAARDITKGEPLQWVMLDQSASS